ncbi:MAG TPA: 50S ribosomal protein L25/general stress protein Ctc [Gammaproteobacteria bacterium]|nr:50S ribosomal protein L25/general stress protein Ctc [Gammaproteobacteria bacterium]
MSTLKFELEADVRADVGKGASRRLRHTDKVPAVVYGGGEKSVSLTLDHNKTMHALSHEAFYSHILNLKIGKAVEKVILKDVQRDPAKPRIAHVDFLRVRADQKLNMHVPLHFRGAEEAPGMKEGGVFSHLMNDVEVSCLPADLPEFIEVDISGMVLNHTLHLSDLKLPKGVELTAFAHGQEEHNHPVVTIHIPRIIEEEVVETVAEEAEGALAADTAEGGAETAAGTTSEPTEK